MSVEKNKQEANRWFKTAEDDLDSSRVLHQNGKYAHACFHAQQAGEKALKAIWYLVDADPWGHSISKLIHDLQQVDVRLHGRLASIKRSAILLDRFYIPTRYPNGLPDITPAEAYLEEDAISCIEHAGKILGTIKLIIG